MKSAREKFGRPAIEAILEQYEAARVFRSAADVRDFLHTAFADNRKIAKCTSAQAAAWERTARYERESYVSTPVGKTGHLRDPNASRKLREVAERAANKDLSTRMAHRALTLQKAAQEPGRTDAEVRRAERAAMALEIIAGIALITDDEPRLSLAID